MTTSAPTSSPISPVAGIYAIGGWNGALLTTVEKYDIDTDSWTAVTSMPSRRVYLGAVSYHKHIFVFGGDGGDGSLPMSVDRYSPAADNWVGVANMTTWRGLTAAAVLTMTKFLSSVGLTRM